MDLIPVPHRLTIPPPDLSMNEGEDAAYLAEVMRRWRGELTRWVKTFSQQYDVAYTVLAQDIERLSRPAPDTADVARTPWVGQGLAEDAVRGYPVNLATSRFANALQLANGSDLGKVTVSFSYLGVGTVIVGSGATVTYTADLAVVGANGLRSGLTEAANTWYAVFIIVGDDGPPANDPTGNNLQSPLVRRGSSVAAFLDTSATPTLPSGFNRYRRVGWVRNNGSSNLYRFTQSVNDEWTWWNEDLTAADFRVVNVTSVAALNTWYDADASKVVPSSSRECRVNAFMTDAAPGEMVIRLKNKDHGNSGNYGPELTARYVDELRGSCTVGVDSTQAFQYQTTVLTRDIILDVMAYRDIV